MLLSRVAARKEGEKERQKIGKEGKLPRKLLPSSKSRRQCNRGYFSVACAPIGSEVDVTFVVLSVDHQQHRPTMQVKYTMWCAAETCLLHSAKKRRSKKCIAARTPGTVTSVPFSLVLSTIVCNLCQRGVVLRRRVNRPLFRQSSSWDGSRRRTLMNT